jgi:4'-phosphopantetheinyl transferase EntD
MESGDHAFLAVSFPGVAVERRRVMEGDEMAILAEEAGSFSNCAAVVRRQGGAARIAARKLLNAAGYGNWPLLRRVGIGPMWPPGIVGSLSHSENHAVAALASSELFAGLGIDVEPTAPLPMEILSFVALPQERELLDRGSIQSRILFCAKEAAYKAVYPIDGRFLEMHDILVDFSSNFAITSYGRRVELAFHIDSSIIAVGTVGYPLRFRQLRSKQ